MRRAFKVRSIFAFVTAVSLLLSSSVTPARAATLTMTASIHIIQGTTYSNTAFLTPAGGTAPYTFSNWSLPKAPGITLNSDGSITGLTCAASNGNDTATATITDSTSPTPNVTVGATTSYVVNASPHGACTITSSSAITTTATVGTPYSSSITPTGGNGSYYCTLDSGTLPPGLSVAPASSSSTAASCTVSGTPTTAGSYSFILLYQDTSGANGISSSYTVTVAAGSALSIATATLPTPVITKAYSQTVQTSGGTAPVTFAVSAGSLPAGLSLSTSTGVISGTPTTAGAYSFTIKATDASSATATKAYSGTIAAAPAISATTLPTPLINQAYSQTVTTTGGTAPLAFSVSAGSAPAEIEP
jgi:hypothetical protein